MQTRLAVLIDAENVSAKICDLLIQEIANYGVASVKRAYGDWTTHQLNSWKSVLHEYAITPIQQFSYTKGKNSTDSSMIIDAMDLLYTKNINGFCLVTSDCDFTRLATRIRESGLLVYGFGKQHASDSLKAACDKFVYLEALKISSEEKEVGNDSTIDTTKQKTKKELNQDTKLINLLRGAVKATADDNGWADISSVGSHIAKQSSFDSRNYGYKKLSKLIEVTELFDMEKCNIKENNSYNLYIRDKRLEKDYKSN